MTKNMGINVFHRAFLTLAALLLLSPSVHALQPGVEIKAGTLGIGADLVLGVNDYFSGRVGVSKITLEDDFEDSDNLTYDAELTLGGSYAMLDYHPFASGFRISAGLMSSGIELQGDAKLPESGSVTVGGNTYTTCNAAQTSGQVCGMSSGVDFAGAKPYLGLGWGASYDSNISFSLDIGVMVQGDADVDVNVQLGPDAGGPSQAQVDAEIAALEDEIASSLQKSVYPVLSFGIAIAF